MDNKITLENINSYSLCLRENKSLYTAKIDKLLIFMLQNIKDKSDLYSKIKVLMDHPLKKEKDDIRKNIFNSICQIKGIQQGNIFYNSLQMIEEESKLFRTLILFYYKGEMRAGKKINILIKRILEINGMMIDNSSDDNSSGDYNSSDNSSDYNSSDDDMDGNMNDMTYNTKPNNNIYNLLINKKDNSIPIITNKLIDWAILLLKTSKVPFLNFDIFLIHKLENGPKLIKLYIKQVIFTDSQSEQFMDMYFDRLSMNSFPYLANVIGLVKRNELSFDWDRLFRIVAERTSIRPNLMSCISFENKYLISSLKDAKQLSRYFKLLKIVIRREKSKEVLEEMKEAIKGKCDRIIKILDDKIRSVK
ncbi:hypothetical protein TCON_0790 [Astathelohania contejeani]|uniref:Uncharacterized protein n=1 Tax=Astathelohania contejeani TaxID=164912 RepID=A0ABQ7I0Q0_9MICR|nr:hypothetical protein TCON_0790 [Thelohania contejeani]